MKTIEQAIADFIGLKHSHPEQHIYELISKSFRAGMDFSQQWIAIRDELPSEEGVFLVKDIADVVNIARFSEGRFYFSGIGIDGDWKYCFVSKTALKRANYLLNIAITHWRQI